MNPRATVRLALLLVLLTALAVGLWAQATTSLRGTVMDPAGAVVPGAKLILTNVATGAIRQTETDAGGGYLFAALPPGMYRLRVEAKGFKTVVREGMELLVNVPLTLNLGLELGQLTEVVSVSEEAPLLNTTDATLGNVITNRQIIQLPLEARNIMSLLSLQAGVTFFQNREESVGDYRNGAVNGGKSDQSNVTLDGVDINDQLFQFVNGALRVTPDSLQEFRMTTASPTATQGRSSGAQIGMVTKSGSNSFHGSLYEFHRNTVTSANEWFLNSTGQGRRKYLKNVFGASAGGPIVKERFFFFLNYEGRRDRQEAAAIRTVPSADMRNGFLSYITRDGSVRRLSPEELRALDPGRIGPNPAVLAVFQQYPLPNDDSVGDTFNIRGFRFPAPVTLDLNTYIARFDYKLTGDSRHTLFWRGNLQDDKTTSTPQFPGHPPQFTNLNNTRASAVGYTAVLGPALVNDLRWGFTRQGLESAGASTVSAVSFRGLDDPFALTRSNGRKLPVHNLVDDLTWTRGGHTFNFGGNVRWIRRDSFSFGNSFHGAITNVSWLIGTGADLRPTDLATAFRVAWQDAFMASLGIISQGTARYNYDKTGSTLGLGAPVLRLYGANEYEWYVQDSWKIKPNFTLTLGVRHSLFSPPWELRGNQVGPNISLGQWFDLRGGNMEKGIPSNQAPRISFDLAGPANGGRKGFYEYDRNNFAPRVAIAWSPGFTDGWLKKLTGGPGRTSIRAGYSIAYDHIGAGLANTFDVDGAFGMSTILRNPSSSLRPSDPNPQRTAPRFTGLTNLPPQVILPAPPGGFPATPRRGIFLITSSIDDTIRTPYSQMIAFSIQRQLPANFSLEVGYVGRLSRKSLIQDDLAMPLDLKDPASGTTYFQAANLLWDAWKNRVAPAAIQSIPYWENLFPGLRTSTKSATRVAYETFLLYDVDVTSMLLDLDVLCDPACSRFGSFAYFADQYSALAAWRSRAMGNYHAMEVMLRKRFSHGFQFDLNYTWSKSIDWASFPERSGTYSGFTINAWSPGLNRSVSDYDATQQLNINGVFELPFGQGKKFGGNVNRALDAFIGGWQIGGIYRHTTGLPIRVGNGRFWPTNWNITGYATAIKPFPKTKTTKNAPGIRGGGPNLFEKPLEAITHFDNTRPGQIGDRNQIRGDGLFNIDLNLAKTWRITESHRLQFRWEVFNLTNSVRFNPAPGDITLDLGAGRANFGKYSGTLTQPRVMQFGLRYEF